jgi:tetratricopeptide (TPR) repeat protein
MLGDFGKAKKSLDNGLYLALDINKSYGLGWLELCYGHLFQIMGDGRNSIEHFQKSIKYQEEAQSIFMLGIAWAGLGAGYWLLGDPEAAKEYIEKGLTIHKDAELPYYLSYIFWLSSMVQFDLGDLKIAQKNVEEALTLSRARKERHLEGISGAWLGRIQGKTGISFHLSEQRILEGMGILKELKLLPYLAQGHLFLGELYADEGQREESLNYLKKAEEMFEEMGMDYWLTETKEALGKT